MSLQNIFSLPLIRYKIHNWGQVKKEFKKVLPKLDKSLLKDDIYTDYFLNDLELPSYSDKILSTIKPYLADLSQNNRIYITDMWFQTALRGMNHTCHNQWLGWSAIIYVDYDITCHTATKFYSPFPDPFNGAVQSYIPTIEEGTLLIFPSNIVHEALPNTSDIPRTIISFNLTNQKQTIKKVLFD